VIEADWEGIDFLVCATDDEHVVVRFAMSTLEEEPGLIAYMNVLAASHAVVTDNRLRKVVEDWNVTPGDGYLYFTFRPPWVRASKLETYFALHPEEKVFKPKPRAADAHGSDGEQHANTAEFAGGATMPSSELGRSTSSRASAVVG
jgi:hypothetical protein